MRGQTQKRVSVRLCRLCYLFLDSFFYIVDPSMQCISMLDSVKVEGIFRAKLCFFFFFLDHLPLFLLLLRCVETLISCITRSDFGVGFRTFHIQILCISVS